MKNSYKINNSFENRYYNIKMKFLRRLGVSGTAQVMDDLTTTSPAPNEGVGNSYDFGARMYDPRVVRFFSLDKIKKPFISPFIYVSKNPIAFLDPDGNDDFYFNKKGGLFGYTANNSAAHRIFRENSSGTYQFAGNNYLLKMKAGKLYQEHHNLPIALINHDVVKSAMSAGFNLKKGENNLLYLPKTLLDGSNFHNGSHPAYQKYIENELENYEGNSPQDARKFIEDLIPKATEKLYNSVQSGQKLNESFKEEKK